MGKITSYAALSSPASADLLPVVDVSDTSMASSGTTKNITLSTLKTFTGSGGGGAGPSWIAASGDTTGATDYANIQAALNSAFSATPFGRVYLGPFIYYINHPLIVPPGCGLIGVLANEVAEVTGGGIQSGSVVLGSTTFTQGTSPANGMVVCLSQTDGSYSVVSEEQKIYGICFDGGNIPTSVHNDGLAIMGGCKRIHAENVLLSHMNNHGVNIITGTDGAQCNATRLKHVTARYAGANGFNLFRSSDGGYWDCLAENCTGDGWFITNLSNGKVVGCRAEHNTNGFTFNGQSAGTGSGGATFSACSTDGNDQHGWNITTAGGPTPVLLSGCYARRDGVNGGAGGGNCAGINITNYPSAVQIAGCAVWPGIKDDGTGSNSPQYGLRVTTNTGGWIAVTGSWLQGATGGIQDDASSAIITYGTSFKAHGPTTGPLGVALAP